MIAARAKVVVIDDTPNNLLALGASLSNDFEMFMAITGEDGLALVEQHQPDIVLLDIMMPGMDGFEVCRRLKANDRLKNIPVVMVTALTDARNEEKGLQLGAADFITKPIVISTARQRIYNLIEREQLRRSNLDYQNHLEAKVAERTHELATAKELAEAANRAKNTLLSNMGHEFRTPLNAITGMLDLARHRAVDPKQISNLATASEAARDLLTMLNNLLDLSDLESRRLSVGQHCFELAPVMRRLATLFGEPATSKGIHLNFDVHASLSTRTLVGDPQRLGQVLSHLIDNAVKFTQEGHVSASVKVLREHHNGVELHFSVSDTGPGVAESDLSRIFLPFTQIDDSRTRRHPGAGLGLALAKNLVQLMGGHMWVNSKPGSGSTFDFNLRFSNPGAATTEAPDAMTGVRQISASQTLRSTHAGKRVLLIEGETVTRELIKHLLELADLRVSAALTLGDAAKHMDPEKPFDLVVIAVDTPDVNNPGQPHAPTVKSPGIANAPLIGTGLSALPSRENGWPLSEMHSYLEKPIHAQMLYEAVLSALSANKADA